MEYLDMIDEVPFNVSIEDMVIEEQLDDMSANACIRKISNWESYRAFWKDYYEKKLKEMNDKCDNNIAFQKRKLRYYYQSVPHRKTSTMEVYDLPNGRLCMTFSKPKMVPDKESIIKRLKENGEGEFIKVKEELDWNGYKSRLFISDSGDVLDQETGEVVSDVSIETPEPDFSVKANKEKEGEEE